MAGKLILLLLALVLAPLCVAQSAPIIGLPGLDFAINFAQYSGYVQVNSTRSLFFWFVESQTSPSTAPIVFWFQGGPGCSGLLGFFDEHGPFQISAGGGQLSPNPYSWNRIANMVYVESPAGVGFSYSTQPNWSTGDNQTMVDSTAFVLGFFKQYPQFAKNDMYISGESYGGHYVPQLAWYLLQNKVSVNLKGILVGNPWTDDKIDGNSAVFTFLWGHGLISYAQWLEITQSCNYSTTPNTVPNVAGVIDRDFEPPLRRMQRALQQRPSASPACNVAEQKGINMVGNFIDQYDIYYPCLDGAGGLACENYTKIIQYLNDPNVRKALGVKAGLPSWTPCANINYVQSWPSVLPIYPYLFNNTRVTIYSGDVTFNCPFEGSAVWTEMLAAPRGVISDYKAWEMQGEPAHTVMVGGWVKRWNGLTFVTVRDAGHMVPEYQPAAGFQVLSWYLNGTF